MMPRLLLPVRAAANRRRASFVAGVQILGRHEPRKHRGDESCGLKPLSGFVAEHLGEGDEVAMNRGRLAIVVEVMDEGAAALYRDFGLASFPNRPLRPFMPASEAAEAVSRALLR
jgi:hypothetical protein